MADLTNDIERYRKGDMSPEEMHALEKKALSDPFLADALEGAMSIEPADFTADVASLDQSIKGGSGSREGRVIVFTPLRLAAGIALIVGAALTVWLMGTNDEPSLLSKVESSTPAPAATEPKADSTATSATEAAQPQELPQLAKSSDATTTKPKIVRAEPEKLERQPIPSRESELALAYKDKDSVIADVVLQGGVTTTNKKQVTGSVLSSEDGLPLPGVNVTVKGTTTGTTTDLNGNYTIELPESSSLVFSFVGLQTVETNATGNEPLNVKMKEDVSQLSEVVVTRSALPKPETEGPVVKLAEPVGGIKAYDRYMEDNLRYPKQALDNNVKGRVVVEFSVGVDGKIDNFVVMKSLGYGCDDEVIRLVKEGPEWIPSTEDSQPVETSVRVRMRFDPAKAKKKK